ncbi:glycine zipper family protein [Agarivorans aestuarii]|uniref:Glycine zipper family protein n=1 Tax=Agarivorans aestuarii TaxID=1563703 RepID=A0ABU7G079_9ALTE|nr:glycine zipper family protein [Agarivorans aestuarii]MEE1672832.1 glycine zipper family protein [Agarivorans aestuarii]
MARKLLSTQSRIKRVAIKATSFSLLAISISFTSGCANTAEGAGTGALAGAAGGLVSGLIWGGDPLESAARGAAVGAASGAAVGAVQDAKQSSAEQAPQESTDTSANQLPSKEQLIAAIGEPAVDGIVALAKCDYSSALSNAQLSKAASEPHYQEAGVWLEALSYAETGDVDKLNASYTEIIKLDKQVSNVLEAQTELSESLSKLKQIRLEHDLPESCS